MLGRDAVGRGHAEVGGFDPSYRYVVDWDFWLRVAATWDVDWLHAPTVDIRWHLRSETHRFATGLADLDETARLLDALFASDGRDWPDASALQARGRSSPGRACLNRAHVALKGGDAGLAPDWRWACAAVLAGDRGTIARDPRLAVQMAARARSRRDGWARRFRGAK